MDHCLDLSVEGYCSITADRCLLIISNLLTFVFGYICPGASQLRKTNFSLFLCQTRSLATTGRISIWDNHLHKYSNGSGSSVNCASGMTEACRNGEIRRLYSARPMGYTCNEGRVSRCIIYQLTRALRRRNSGLCCSGSD